jgi:4-hydroxybenzoyl-CoA reductase subunit beta
MLPYPAFHVQTPNSITEALEAKDLPESLFIAGGTDLGPSLKHRIFRPKHLISLSSIAELRQIEVLSEKINIGPMCTLAEIESNPHIRTHLPLLSSAVSGIGTRTIQHMGTLGGNIMLDTRCLYYNQPQGWREAIKGCLKADGELCHVAPKGNGCYAAHSADSVPLLWLLNTELHFQSRSETVIIPLKELYGDDGRTWLDRVSNMLLTNIQVPYPKGPMAHRKLRLRASIDYAQLLVAVQKEGPNGTAVISAVGPKPIEVSGPIEDLPEIAYRNVQPLKTHDPLPTWRKQMVRVEVKRALSQCQ